MTVSGGSGPRLVTPFARALSLLEAFTPDDPWLGNRELAARTRLPASTIARMTKCLVSLGYLRHAPRERSYRLAAPVLALGYAALTNSDVQRAAKTRMQTFADQNRVHVMLGSRERLDLIVLESCAATSSPLAMNVRIATRMSIASSPSGWALLAALPELERYYLMENIERHTARDWPRVRRRLGEAVAQVHDTGYCTSIAEWERDMAIVAAPLVISGHAPLVLSCVGSSSQISRTRVQRELGPRLLALGNAIAAAVGAPS